MSIEIFDEEVAATYDTYTKAMSSPEVLGPVVDRLEELARGGPVLEFAIGTGRVAIPLANRGLDVTGIDVSEPMVAQLRAKLGVPEIPVTIGDMAKVRLDRKFNLVYLVFNTISNLLTQDEQVSCFANAAAHLSPNGLFLIEVGIPALRQLPPGQRLVPCGMPDGHLCIDEFDVVDQRLVSHHYRTVDGRCLTFHSPHRYAWPAEYDLMARLADMTLEHRWANWQREPLNNESEAHISVWAKQ